MVLKYGIIVELSTLIDWQKYKLKLLEYASLYSIYCETGWEKLIVRGEVKKLNLFYKIINNEAPEYLSELIPPTVAESNNYNLRNRHNTS